MNIHAETRCLHAAFSVKLSSSKHIYLNKYYLKRGLLQYANYKLGHGIPIISELTKILCPTLSIPLYAPSIAADHTTFFFFFLIK